MPDDADLDYDIARDLHQRVKTLEQIAREARHHRDEEIRRLLDAGGRVNEVARQIGCSEGNVRIAKRQAQK